MKEPMKIFIKVYCDKCGYTDDFEFENPRMMPQHWAIVSMEAIRQEVSLMECDCEEE